MTSFADHPDHVARGAAGALLTVDLDAVRANYRLVRELAGDAACAAVVKADGYGLGAAAVAAALAKDGCSIFFVAHLQEAISLRRSMPLPATIIVLHGSPPGAEALFVEHAITPVLNTPEQVAGWRGLAQERGARLDALLQVDTGMSRFGLSEAELGDLLRQPDGLAGIDLLYVMSHLACADTPGHPANAAQLACFQRMRACFPGIKASLSASSGIFLGADFRFDLVRPGAALYGVAPMGGQPNPLQQTVLLQGLVVQTRDVATGIAVGYGHTVVTRRPTRLATIAVGYADGFLRSTGSTGAVWVGETRLPLMGRVSMDSIIVDATDLPQPIEAGALVELIGPHNDVDAVALAAGTVGYEVLTGLGHRYARRVIGG